MYNFVTVEYKGKQSNREWKYKQMQIQPRLRIDFVNGSRERSFIFRGICASIEPNCVCFVVAKESYRNDSFPATMRISCFMNQVFSSSSKEISAL